MEFSDISADISEVLYTEEQLQSRLAEMAREIERDYAGKEVLIVGVLKGAVIVISDLIRELKFHAHIDFMAVSSYGASTQSSGVVRIVKDLDADLRGKHVLIVEDIIDSGLTLAWIVRNLELRHPESIEVCAMLRKPDAIVEDVRVKYVGFDIPNKFVVGYGLDYAEQYRNIRGVGVLNPSVYSDGDPHA